MTTMSSNRPVPYVRIVHQPSPIYRMRYKAENRLTFLYAESYQSNEKQSFSFSASSSISSPSSSSSSSSSASSSASASPSSLVASSPFSALSSAKRGGQSARKKNGQQEHSDGTFPKIEVKLFESTNLFI